MERRPPPSLRARVKAIATKRWLQYVVQVTRQSGYSVSSARRVLAGFVLATTSACQSTPQDFSGPRFVPETRTVATERAPSGAEKILYSFQNGSDGAFPRASLIVDKAGNLYGTADNAGGAENCSVHCGTVFELSPPATNGTRWQFTTLYAFTGGKDGGLPTGNVIFGPDGSLFGTTDVGGVDLKHNGKGVAFHLGFSGGRWKETVLHRFGQGTDSAYPHGGLVFDKRGNLYGTTALGGPGQCLGGCGNVYELSPPARSGAPWTETILHTFAGGTDGEWPQAGLVIDRAGRLFGTTEFGGFYSEFCGSGCGTAFELTPSGSGTTAGYAVIHRFQPGNAGDGALPLDPLTLDAKGNLFGTALEGLPNNPGYAGMAFELERSTGTSTWTEHVLYNFPQYTNDAAYSHAGLIFDGSGNLYGTSEVGGTSQNVGTAFKLIPPSASKHRWTDVILYAFNRAHLGAIYPQTNLVFGAGGLLYGTTPLGGSGSSHSCIMIKNKGCGTIFAVTP